MNDKVFYVGATSELEAAWRWEQNVKNGTTFISSEEKGWVDDEVARINAENPAPTPESGDVILPMETYRIAISIKECRNMGKHSNPGASFDDQYNEAAASAAAKPEPTLQQQQATASEARADLAKPTPGEDG